MPNLIEQVKGLNSRLEASTAELATSKLSVTDLTAKVASITEQANTLTLQVTDLSGKISAKDAEIVELNTKLTAANGKVTELETSAKGVQAEVNRVVAEAGLDAPIAVGTATETGGTSLVEQYFAIQDPVARGEFFRTHSKAITGQS